MNGVIQGVRQFLVEDEGVTMVEYGLLAALISIVCIAALGAIGTQLNTLYIEIKDCLAGGPGKGTCPAAI